MYSGTIVPLMTPLNDDETVDERSTARLIDHVRSEVSGLMPALTSGEGWKLDERQWTDIVTYTVRHSGALP
ncbi:dihydrodipicolinate synthase family protein, partial [Streptomyces goshikiensis]